MTIRTLLRYLVGDRQAILDLASTRWTLVVGFLFVLSAGFAREYDGQDLRREPWHLVVPLGASLVSSFALFCLAMCGRFGQGERRPPFLPAYLSFLGLFWMTAPLAWFYAIPYERFLSPVGAVGANLWTLALVSLWRVALMIRVLVVVLNYRPWDAACVVLLFGDTVALVLFLFLPISPAEMMGGIRGSERDRLVSATAVGVVPFGACSWLFWLNFAIVGLISSRLSWRVSLVSAATGLRPNLPLWLLVLACLGSWAWILPRTQPEQQLRSRVEKATPGGQDPRSVGRNVGPSPLRFPPALGPASTPFHRLDQRSSHPVTFERL